MGHRDTAAVEPASALVLTGSSIGLVRDLSRQTMREVIAGKVAALVASQVLQVGDELPSERALAAALSVSRETIRGAIQLLAARGILEVAQGTRTKVAKSDVDGFGVSLPGRLDANSYTLEEVHAARVLVEKQVVADAARHIPGHVLAALRRSLSAQEACLEDPVQFLICDREFHATIYRCSGNTLLADLAVDLYGYVLDSRRRVVSRPGRIAESVADHRAIVEALAAHDAEAAVSAFARHEMRIYRSTAALLAEAGKTRAATASAEAKPEHEG